VPNAKDVEGPVWDEFLFNDAKQASAHLAFAAASLDKSKARLTVRMRNDAGASVVPPGGWEFADARTIRLLPPGKTFQAGALPFGAKIELQAVAARAR